MSDWPNFANGSWGDAAKWTGGVPDAAGATANFTASSANGALAIISFAQGVDFTVGTLNIVTNANDSYVFRGQVDATLATLRFGGLGGSPAFLNVDTNGSSSQISSSFGLRIVLDSDLIVSTANTDTSFEISAPIIGSGRDIYKFGTGTLRLSGDNSAWTGDLLLRGGRTEITNNAAEGGGVVELDNAAALVGSGNFGFSSAIETRTGLSSGIIAATTGSEMQLFGKVSLRSDAAAAIVFGSATDQGTISLSTGSESIVTGTGGFTIAGGTVRFGSNNSLVTGFFNNLSSTGLLQIQGGGTLDTRGLAIRITNLDLDGGTIRTSLDGLSLFITDTTAVNNSQAGTIIGTANGDFITVNITNSFSFGDTTFSSWTNGTDGITLNGNNGANSITGSSQNDAINGGGGNDTLTGSGGVDTIRGGTGDDNYRLSDTLSALIENAGEGTDTITVLEAGPAQFMLETNFENLSFAGSAARIGIGNSVANVITGGLGADRLFGLEGDDILRGIGGADELDGGIGADQMEGGTGDDIFFVDNAGDSIVELAGAGADTVLSGISFTLTAGAAVEVLSAISNAATDAIDLTGNALNQDVIGNKGVNWLDGGAGADRLIGLGGSDFYVIDNGGDSVVEFAGDGNDYVLAQVSWALASGAEVETVSTISHAATNAINLTGNEFGQDVIGNNGVNTLDGGTGADRLIGLGGNDIYAIDNAADSVVEFAGDGNDYVLAQVSWVLAAGAEVETVSTASHAATDAINFTGNEFGQDMIGNNGVNRLDGGAGADRLIGLGGNDQFAFTSALGGGNVDVIFDFAAGGDKVLLDDAIFTGLSLGTLAAGAFKAGTGATDADDRIIYNNTTGALFFDADGVGGAAAVQFASLSTGLALAATDFTVI